MPSPAARPRFTDIFVIRPVLAVVISLALIIGGLQAASSIPVLEFPQIESSSLVISTAYVGAPASVVQGFVTEPIERVASTVPGVDYVDSSTTAGSSTVTVWLKLNEDSTAALAELSSRLSQIRYELPAGAEDPAVTVQRADRSGALFYLDVITGEFPRAAVTDYLERHVTPLMGAIDGVQRALVEPGRNPAMRIWLDPARMAAFDISAGEVQAALVANNVIATIGTTENRLQRLNLIANTTLQTVEDFERLVLRESDGALLYLRDIARVELGEEEGEVSARYSQQDALYLSIWPVPGANEIAIGDDLYEVLEKINATLPDGLRIRIAYDGTLYMRDAIREIFITLAETIVLVGIVVLALMGSVRTALVPLVTIPISLLGAIAAITLDGLLAEPADDTGHRALGGPGGGRRDRGGGERRALHARGDEQARGSIGQLAATADAHHRHDDYAGRRVPAGRFPVGPDGRIDQGVRVHARRGGADLGRGRAHAVADHERLCLPAARRGGPHDAVGQHALRRAAPALRRLLARVLGWRAQVLAAGLFFSLLMVPFYLLSQKELAPIEDQSSINSWSTRRPSASLEYTHATCTT
jgi:multidrug efflux pump